MGWIEYPGNRNSLKILSHILTEVVSLLMVSQFWYLPSGRSKILRFNAEFQYFVKAFGTGFGQTLMRFSFACNTISFV